MLSNLTWKQTKRQVKGYFVSLTRIINCQGFNKCMEKEKGEINSLVYMGKWRDLVGVEPKFCPKAGH